MIDVLRAQREGPERIARRQGERLNQLVSVARSRSPLMRDVYATLPTGVIGLADLPVVRKRDLMSDFDSWVTDPRVTRSGVDDFISDPQRIGAPYLDSYFVCRSSGTTGVPGTFVHDRRAVRAYMALSVRMDLAWLSLRDWWAFATRRARWIAVVGTGGPYAGEGWMELQRRRDPVRRRFFAVLPLQSPLPEIVTRLNALKPVGLTSYGRSGWLNALARLQTLLGQA